MVKNVLVADAELFIENLKKDLIKNNISHLIIHYDGYYELHLDNIIFRVFKSTLIKTNNSSIIYDYIVNEIFKYMCDVQDTLEIRTNERYSESKNKKPGVILSKKKALKINNAKYKVNNRNNIKLMRSKKLC